jgi:hypothetical protein
MDVTPKRITDLCRNDVCTTNGHMYAMETYDSIVLFIAGNRHVRYVPVAPILDGRDQRE